MPSEQEFQLLRKIHDLTEELEHTGKSNPTDEEMHVIMHRLRVTIEEDKEVFNAMTTRCIGNVKFVDEINRSLPPCFQVGIDVEQLALSFRHGSAEVTISPVNKKSFH